MVDLTSEQKKYLLQVVIGLVIVINLVLGIITHAFVLTELALYVGLLIGIAIKVAIPFIRKLSEGKVEKFEFKYIWMIIVTFFYSIPITFAGVQNIDLTGISAGWVLFGAVFIGLGLQWITEEVWRIVKNAKSQFIGLGMETDELTEEELDKEIEEPSNIQLDGDLGENAEESMPPFNNPFMPQSDTAKETEDAEELETEEETDYGIKTDYNV